jgi:hypothetical protein
MQTPVGLGAYFAYQVGILVHNVWCLCQAFGLYYVVLLLFVFFLVCMPTCGVVEN